MSDINCAIIDGFPYHRITDDGRIQTRLSARHTTEKWRDMKPATHRQGYQFTYLNFKGSKRFVLIHRLVAMAFIENKESKPEVNHKDGNKKNNHVSNLEWVTGSENTKHAYDHGLIDMSTRHFGKRK